MDIDTGKPAPRRIGTILVERRLITDAELALALKEQEATGRPLGEICVERFGLDRLSLADALAEQWAEMQRASAAAAAASAESETELISDLRSGEALSPEEELRVLLEEAEAARAELASKTDELSRRLAVLETLVVGVSDALRDLRPTVESKRNGAQRTTVSARPKRSRASAPEASSA